MKDFFVAVGQVLFALVFVVSIIMGFVWLGTHDRYTLLYNTTTPYETINKVVSSGLTEDECKVLLSNLKDTTNYECINSWKYSTQSLIKGK